MYVSQETVEQTRRRLLKVIAAAEVRFFEGTYCFRESPVASGLGNDPEALAYVRDDDVWSRLVPLPSGDTQAEAFCLISFHFESGLDNSGFVGWLASHLKQALGTGVFVVCGQNHRQGGIFDYWGCPWDLKDRFFAEVNALRNLV
ncbi:MAG TPA: DUF6196 family protein [Myxococcales bacterium]|nr:DUF6196 family protein [Myxococcales bacterium]